PGPRSPPALRRARSRSAAACFQSRESSNPQGLQLGLTAWFSPYPGSGHTSSMSIQPPSEYQPLQPLLGAVCQLCQTAPSPPRAKICSRPSAFRATSNKSIQPPSEYQPLQPLLGAVCQLCHTAPSPPRVKISSRPSAFRATSNKSIQPPSEYQPLQPLLGAVCQLCQRAPSPPRAKISSRPSAFWATVNRSTLFVNALGGATWAGIGRRRKCQSIPGENLGGPVVVLAKLWRGQTGRRCRAADRKSWQDDPACGFVLDGA